jgi:hypothetical protein
MDNQQAVPQSLLIAEARAKVETVLNAECLSPAVKELIFKEAWLRASMMAEQELQQDYHAYEKTQQTEQQEGA